MRRLRGLRDPRGSITVEAALVLPLFLAFILFLIMMVRITVVDVALNKAASELTKQVSTHMYPVVLSYDYIRSTSTGGTVFKFVDLATKEEARNRMVESLIQSAVQKAVHDPIDQRLRAELSQENGVPDFIRAELINQVNVLLDLLLGDIQQRITELTINAAAPLNGQIQQHTDQWTADLEAAILPQLTPLAMLYADERWLREEYLEITDIEMPDLGVGSHPKFGISLRYNMELTLPFITLEVPLEAKAQSRIWVGTR